MSAAAQRWKVFLEKVSARLDEVLAEAGPALEPLVAAAVKDPVPLSSALTELHARMLGLERKVEDGWAKLEPELQDGDDRDGLWSQGAALKGRISRGSKVLQVKKQADAARLVLAEAQREMAQLERHTRCSSCGAPIFPEVLHEASNVTCSHCKSVSVVRPGLSTLSFFSGAGPHALGEEAALDQSARLEAAQAKYQALRSRRRADVDAWVAAHRAYWLVYARGYGAHVPGWTEAQSKAMAEAKLGGLKWELERVETVD